MKMQKNWIVEESVFDPTSLNQQETVFTVGNGYLGVRGAFEESYPGARPATLVNGVFDDVPIVFTELPNCPDWLPLFISADGELFRLDQGEVLAYRRTLDLKRGILRRMVRWQSSTGRVFEFQFERFASLADQHVLALRCQITAVESEGVALMLVQAGINGYADNEGVLHWVLQDQGGTADSIWVHTHTRHTKAEVGIAGRMRVDAAGAEITPSGSPNYPMLECSFELRPGQTVTVEKVVTVFSSRDVKKPVAAARKKLADLSDYGTLLAQHERTWVEVWESSDVVIEGDPKAQLAVRFNLFQTIIAAPRHDDRVSVPAKTLSGFGYRGHVFWDTEIFVVPFLSYTQPAVARNLLNYRYHTLPGARRKAQDAGYEGAMFAWESAASGDEVTPRWVPGYKGKELVRIWCGDIEHHISADVAYAVWQYWRVTDDHNWMRDYGAEILLDTAVFWGSRAEYNAGQNRYELTDVIGPDEYHDHVDNNAFTNRMVQWHLETALEVLSWLQSEFPEQAAVLESQLDLSPARLAHWQDIIARIWVLYDPATGLIEQSQNFFELQQVDLAEYEPRDRSMQSILGIEGANQCQVLKQADVLMLLYLLPEAYDRHTLEVNWDYYNPRTDHTYGSSLGPCIHAILASKLGRSVEAYEHFMRAALVDLEDVRGNTADGIHAASAGGLWQSAVFGFAGVEVMENGPVAHPHLPPGWERLAFRLQVGGHWYQFDLRPDTPAPYVPTPVVHGVIFDLDGVLTDTSEFHYQGWQRLADDEGIPFDRAANDALRGLDRRASLIKLLNGRPATEEQIQGMMARKNGYYQELIERITSENLLPGVLELLEQLRAVGIKIAIGSASKNARPVIEWLGIENLIDAVSDGYSVAQHKPAPDLFLHAAEQLNVPPSQCVVFEDAAAGVAAARAAGMWAVGLGPASRLGSAHLVLPGLDGVQWVDVLPRLARFGSKA